MHVPIIHGDVCRGVLEVSAADSQGGRFSQRDLDLLRALASVAALGLENARMHAESLKQERLAQDLRLAEQIQKSFLPRELPSSPGLEFLAEYQPAYSVGGDFYDVFWLGPTQLGMFIGDVAGKGVSAALLMARMTSDLRLAAHAEATPDRVLASVNRAVLARGQHDIFVTCVYLALDVTTRRITLANAGHLPPLVRRAASGQVEPVEGSGTAIGIFEDAEFKQVELTLWPGDTLVLCTDGVEEATNESGQQLGPERLTATLAAGSSAPRELRARVLAEVRRHVGVAPQYDDLTLLLCGVLP
jgi:serine phosphatase RsbU (regulator of sigma subunit)